MDLDNIERPRLARKDGRKGGRWGRREDRKEDKVGLDTQKV